jgi:hypothetical protein
MVLWSSDARETAMAHHAHATSVSDDDPRATSLQGRRFFKWIE